MTMAERISTLVRANINDLVDRAEDPEKVIKQLVADMQGQLVDARTQVAAALADQKELGQRLEEAEQQATDWQHKAEFAVQHGHDDLAREALQRRNSYRETAAGLKDQYDRQAKEVAELKDALNQLEMKIGEAEAKKDLLIARSRRAKAETHIRTALTGIEASGSLASFERMEEKVDQQEARAAALAELETDTIEQKFTDLEQAQEVERELAAMKAQHPLPEAPPSSVAERTQPAAT